MNHSRTIWGASLAMGLSACATGGDLAANKEAALAVSNAIASNSLAARADAVLSADFAYHGPAGSGPKGDGEMNKAEYVGFMSALSAAFTEMQMDFINVVAEGDQVAVHYRNTFKHTGNFMGVPASGKNISITGTFVRRVAKGQVAEEWDNPDMGALLNQLGFQFIPPNP